MLNKDKIIVDFSNITTNELWYQGWYLSSRLILGSICMGLLTGVVGGLGLYFLLKKLSNKI